ncbi:MAG: PSD1 domain-containing protein [Acidobacteria bacterium]|nr:PSD1 domain-containing protein [Acidobacteriota bacterium]
MRGLLILLVSPLWAQSPEHEFFEKKIRPLFVAKCYACHSGKTVMAGLNLATGAGLDGFVKSGDAESSRLYAAVTYKDKAKMPPAGKLAAEEIALLREWIEQGAKRPAVATAGLEKKSASQHWAFQPVRPAVAPAVRNEGWVLNAVDRFVLASLEAKGIVPAPPAEKSTLLRRVTFDLTGLPPTVEELDAFLADSSPDALAKVVDRLLASPRYGERWGRHWLDVARYADSTGMDEDHIYPHAWRYRDYVVKAFQDDLPYDVFLREQIAGDLMKGPERRQERIVATGFLALGPKPLAQQDRVKMIYDVVDEQIDTVSKSLMGLTVSCARCHDHKFDPIPTKDYYGLAGIFASTTSFRNLGRPGSVSYVYYAPLDAGAYGIYQAHRWRLFGKRIELEDAMAEDATRENALLRPRIAEYLVAAWNRKNGRAVTGELDTRQLDRWTKWLGSQPYLEAWNKATPESIAKVAAEYQDAYAKSGTSWDTQLANWRRRMATEVASDRDVPERPKFDAKSNPFFAAATFEKGPMELADSPRVAQLRAEYDELQRTLPPEPAMASAVADGPIVDQRLFVRGDHLNPGEPVAKHFLSVLSGGDQPKVAGSGRLELAQWLTRRDHPLTARVMVNRIWQWHFGEALVRTPNNWGTTGEKPAHPELLDYLAHQFVQSGWSVKAMHRLIVLSNAYRMSAMAGPPVKEADPSNRLFSRFPRTRMSVEQLRDSILFLSGEIDLAIGGSMLPTGKGKRPKMDPEEMTRRTLYVPVRRGSIPALLATFDYGDATTSSEGRGRTNVAPQALFLRNSKFAVERSVRFADRVLATPGLSESERVRIAYRMAFSRMPAPEEADATLTYLTKLAERLGGNEARRQAWGSLCHVLISSNEFLYLD